ncbi:LOW QUALITY PROTEIN: uncharacterized protein LOC143368769 [Andrena cerasifolii]|uniref:LOW QUALITY PROTEIN: uncharacterized protein LOC143368769 n=1 Tax=Andrena cerasifolii TaxID=2819439 RepID=UPI0040384CB8
MAEYLVHRESSFKRKHGLRQRKITRYVSSGEVASMEEILEAATRFRNKIKNLSNYCTSQFIINTDQTGCQYQSSINRTLAVKGSKSVFVKSQTLNKLTHSYTAQYSVTMSGDILPHVFICLQETNNTFGPRVQKQVDQFMKTYPNTVVTCSKSGKLTKQLYAQYLTNIVKPYVQDNKFLLIIDSWGGGREGTDRRVYDEIFPRDNNNTNWTLAIIPPKCTPLVQPCDVYFYRQVKIFIKKLQHCTFLMENQRELTQREDAVKIHSLLHHQITAPIFKPMIRYAWYAAGLIDHEKPTFQNLNQVCFPANLLYCECKKISLLKCAWCFKELCFVCVFDQYHPKHCTQNN